MHTIMFVYEWLVVLFLVTEKSDSSTNNTIDCLDNQQCRRKDIICQDGADCYVNCLAGNACTESTVYCPSGPYDCIINSTGNCASCNANVYGSSQVGNLLIIGDGEGPHFPFVNCPSNGGHCNLTQISGRHGWRGSIITTTTTTGLLYIYTGGAYALIDANITCPKRHVGGFENNCIIYVYSGGAAKMRDASIYAIESWTDINITCEDATCGDDGPITMYCTEDYSESCTAPIGLTVIDRCNDTSSICNDYTLMPTSLVKIY